MNTQNDDDKHLKEVPRVRKDFVLALVGIGILVAGYILASMVEWAFGLDRGDGFPIAAIGGFIAKVLLIWFVLRFGLKYGLPHTIGRDMGATLNAAWAALDGPLKVKWTFTVLIGFWIGLCLLMAF